jgi:RNA polymerase sigma-B factor
MPARETIDVVPLIERWQRDGDRAAYDAAVRESDWLAARLARRFADRGEPYEDLLQVARLGLLKAIDRFDSSLGSPFPVFATPTIVGELRRYFRDHTWSVHVPRRAKDMQHQLKVATETLVTSLQRPPLPAELAEQIGVSVDVVLEALEATQAYRAASYDAHPLLVASAHVADEYAAVDDRDAMRAALPLLPERLRVVLAMRFDDELTQSQIAERIGTSQVHAGRLLNMAIAQLRSVLATHDSESGEDGTMTDV